MDWESAKCTDPGDGVTRTVNSLQRTQTSAVVLNPLFFKHCRQVEVAHSGFVSFADALWALFAIFLHAIFPVEEERLRDDPTERLRRMQDPHSNQYIEIC